MVEERFSCINEITRVIHVALPSIYISNEIAGISDIFESWKRQYIPKLEGVVVSYKNVSIVSAGYILNEKPFVHYDVKATFELFCPNVGSIVKGKVNRVSHDYIGCLVHNTVNVAIKRTFNASDGLSRFIALDHQILFRITCFDFHRKVIRVKGEITEECIDLMKTLSPFNTQSGIFQDSQSTYLSSSELSEDSKSFDTLKEIDDALYEDQSPSLLEPNNVFQNSNAGIFNVDHFAGGSSSGALSTSQESNSTLVRNASKKKSKKHSIVEKQERETDIEEPMEIDDFKLSKKKKHKEKSTVKVSKKVRSNKLAIDSNTDPSGSPIKKKFKKDQYLTPISLPDSTHSRIETSDDRKPSLSPKKKKSSKKSVQNTTGVQEFLSPTSSTVPNSILVDISPKEEIPTDFETVSNSPKKNKSKKRKSNLTDDISIGNVTSNDIENMMDMLSELEPSLTDQLLNEAPFNDIKEEPIDAHKKKRKRDSSDKKGLPSKKVKTEKDQDIVKKSKSKPPKKSKLKKKNRKSDKDSKTEKKKKYKDKHLKSKKDKLSYKIKSKKDKKKTDKKSKTKKHKKSKKKTKEVPLCNSVNSEIN